MRGVSGSSASVGALYSNNFALHSQLVSASFMADDVVKGVR